MSDLFLSTAASPDADLILREMAFTGYTRVISGRAPGLFWAVSRVDDLALWGPAWDDASQTCVLIGGRIALEDAEWRDAERTSFKGGLAARHLLARWLEGGVDAARQYNGAAAVVILDERRRETHILTDRAGFFPVFAHEGRDLTISSHPDLIARHEASHGRALRLDEATIAELLHTGSPTYKHCYWQGVRHLEAASCYVLKHGPDASLGAPSRYWRPAFMDGAPPFSRGEFVEVFSQALRAAGRRRSHARFGKTAVLLSAGADSRGILCATQSPTDVDCYTYFDEPNAELAGAKRIASLAGARHIPLRRTADYYVANAEETVRLSGGMWGIDGGHHTGFANAIRESSRAGVLLTGEFCDLLLKGTALNRRWLQLLGRDVPLCEPAPYQHEHYLPFAPIAETWIPEVRARLDDDVPAALQTCADPRRAEWKRLTPLSRYGAASSILVLWKTTPLDVFLADRDILDAYGRLSVADKVSGIAFGIAVARVTGRDIAAVPNNNFGSPVGTDEAGRLTSFLLSSAMRKLRGVDRMGRNRDPDSVATVGSWPDLTRVALQSAAMREWYSGVFTRHGGLLASLLPEDRRNWSYDEFAANDQFQFYRLITADRWLNYSSAFR